MFIDTHCHLNDERYENIDEIVARMRENGVTKAICAGYDAASSLRAQKLAERYGEVYFTAGIHPDAEQTATAENLKIIEELCAHEKCAAVGEIGLDYHYAPFDKEGQKRAFSAQVELAARLALPFCVHARDCTADMLEFLSAHKEFLKNGFVMHCFSGSAETAERLVELGAYISFAGTLTFKNARTLPQAAAAVPEDRLLTETDSPYLSPHPFRGETNEPARVKYVAEKLAEIRGRSAASLAGIVADNAERIFKRIK